MAYSRQHDGNTPGERAFAVLCLVLARLHAIAGRVTRLLWRGSGWVLRPLPWSCRFGLAATILAVVSLWCADKGQAWAFRQAMFDSDHWELLSDGGYLQTLEHLSALLQGIGVLLSLAALAAFVRRRPAVWLLKVAGAAFVAGWLWLFIYIWGIPNYLHHANAELFGRFVRDQLWVYGTLVWLPWFLLALVFLVNLARRSVFDFYQKRYEEDRDPLGDRVLTNLDTHGQDPRFRTSYYWAASLHVFFLVILPLLNRGCLEEPYGIPKGSGEEVQQQVEVKRVKKVEQEMVLNLNSPILFYRPEIDDRVLDEVMKETERQYEATSLKSLGKGGGKGGGWPFGMENARVRFIRLEYAGGDWDQQMGKGADYNLLIEFQKHTGFKIADKTEHLPIRQLRRFPEHRAPPFVFITGSKGISVSAADVKTLRWYCLEEGGMIFADNGGGSFNSSFRQLMRRTFPDKEWIDIASDDIIFQQPFLFPNGAPPLWHHSGNRALGLKHNGRWIAFYHQGDLNDAWQTGHSGVTPHVADQAYKMGINVINYSFNQYYSIHYGEE